MYTPNGRTPAVASIGVLAANALRVGVETGPSRLRAGSGVAVTETAKGTSQGGLPAPVVEWLEAVLEGRVVRRERSVSRREGWAVDVAVREGMDRQGFLRLERFKDGQLKQPSCQVGLETQVVAALHDRGLAVPAIYAHLSLIHI